MTLRNFVIIATLVGSVFFIFAKMPEAQTFVSSDGRLTIELQGLRQTWVDVRQDNGVYELSSSLSTTREATLRLKTDDLTQRLGFFDKSFGMWRLADTDGDEKGSELVTTTVHLQTSWRVFGAEVIAWPNLEAEIEALIASAPQNAVGYEAVIGASKDQGPYIILDGSTRVGGCDGQYIYTGNTTMTSQEIAFSEVLNYQVVVLWQLGDGCTGYEMIE